MPHRKLGRSDRWAAYRSHRYAILFYALLMMLVVMPLSETLGLPQVAIKFLFGACLLAAVLPDATKRTRWLLLGGVVLLIAGRTMFETRNGTPVASWLTAIVGLVGLAAAAGSLRFAVTSAQVRSETLYAALSTYLLAGLFFGQIYWGLESALPGSFTGPDPLSEVNSVYYSFVTLATLGYGDFIPRNDIARGLAVFEVIGGQLFLAVMVARLIGLFAGPEGQGGK